LNAKQCFFCILVVSYSVHVIFILSTCPMSVFQRFVLLVYLLIPLSGVGQTNFKIDTKGVVFGEVLKYKATWGLFTIGSASTKIDRTLHKVGSAVCFKIDAAGQTNGLAKLFYVRDSWTSYIDTASITTYKSSRSIREGKYELDEQIHFDHNKKKAEVSVYNKKSKLFQLKKIYDTPENIRDVIAGFMVFRLVELSKFKRGEIFTINGFYEDEGYQLNVVYVGEEIIKTDMGKILCYKVKPIVPKNHVFDGKDAVIVWLSADKAKSIVRIKVKMFIGNLWIDLQK